MKELEGHQPIEIIQNKEFVKQYKRYIGTMRLKRGLKLFSFHTITGEILEVDPIKSEVYNDGISDHIKSEDDLVYMQFLNLKAAKKKFKLKILAQSKEMMFKAKFGKRIPRPVHNFLMNHLRKK